jgi:hypothetical protein
MTSEFARVARGTVFMVGFGEKKGDWDGKFRGGAETEKERRYAMRAGAQGAKGRGEGFEFC